MSDIQGFKDSRNVLLGIGIVLPPALVAAYLVRVDPTSEVITIGTLIVICLIGVFAAIHIGRTLKEKYLVVGGLVGYVVLMIMVALFMQTALAPVDWRKTG